jgi:hypothetical protein
VVVVTGCVVVVTGCVVVVVVVMPRGFDDPISDLTPANAAMKMITRRMMIASFLGLRSGLRTFAFFGGFGPFGGVGSFGALGVLVSFGGFGSLGTFSLFTRFVRFALTTGGVTGGTFRSNECSDGLGANPSSSLVGIREAYDHKTRERCICSRVLWVRLM